ILIGQIVDTNSAFISKVLNNKGISVYQITSVQDDKDHILKSLKEAEENADIIIITGGLGPTKDDITKKTIAEYFNDTLVQNKSVLKNIEHLWEHYIKQPLAQVNIDQALVPSKAQVLMNVHGSAPGMWIEHNGKVFISLPGVPFEMKALMENHVIPKLRETYQFPYIKHTTLLTYGLGESSLAARIETWEDNLPNFMKLAYLPGLGRVRLRLSAKHMDKALVQSSMEDQIKILMTLSRYVIGGYDVDNYIPDILGKQLHLFRNVAVTAENRKLANVAVSFPNTPCATKYFQGSVVTHPTQA